MFRITSEGDILRIFRSEDGVKDKADEDTEPVAFFRAPAPISTVDTSGEHIAVGCENGEVRKTTDTDKLTPTDNYRVSCGKRTPLAPLGPLLACAGLRPTAAAGAAALPLPILPLHTYP